MKYSEKFDALDMTGGKYSAHKIPKGSSVRVDITSHLTLEDELSSEDQGGLFSS